MVSVVQKVLALEVGASLLSQQPCRYEKITASWKQQDSLFSGASYRNQGTHQSCFAGTGAGFLSTQLIVPRAPRPGRHARSDGPRSRS